MGLGLLEEELSAMSLSQPPTPPPTPDPDATNMVSQSQQQCSESNSDDIVPFSQVNLHPGSIPLHPPPLPMDPPGGGGSPPIVIRQSSFGKWLSLTREVLANTQSAVDVLNDLLNYDKIEMGTLSLELTVVAVWELVERTVAEFSLQARKAKVQVELDINPPQFSSPPTSFDQLEGGGYVGSNLVCPPEASDLKLVGDVVRFTQVLRNLVSNALKFTPEGGNYSTFCFVFCKPL
jgi:signal transduction histidine kinase